MRRNKPLALVAGAALLALAACGGGGGRAAPPVRVNDSGATRPGGRRQGRQAQGPAPDIEGATAGGTITVYLPGDPGPTDLDPTDGLVGHRQLDPAGADQPVADAVRPRRETGKLVLVPDLATDLGTPNDDFTEWTFTIRDDAKWEDGKPVTAEEVAWGIAALAWTPTRSRPVPAPSTPRPTSSAAGKYKGPYTDKGKKCDGVTVDGQDITIKMAKPFPDMDYWGAFMAMGPAPLGKATKPPNYGQDPLSNGPYMVESTSAQRGAHPGQERPVGPGLRPGASPVRRQVGLQVQPGPGQGRPDHAVGQHRVADRDRRPARLGQVHRGERRAR